MKAFSLLYTSLAFLPIQICKAGPFRIRGLFRGKGRAPGSLELATDDVPSGTSASGLVSQPYSVTSTVVFRPNPVPSESNHDNSRQSTECAASSHPVIPGCMLVAPMDVLGGPLWCGRANWDPMLESLWYTLSLVSDLVIVAAESGIGTKIPTNLLGGLEEGFRQRVRNGLPKGRLIILVDCPAGSELLSAWRKELKASCALGDDILQQFSVVSMSSVMDAVDESPWKEPDDAIGVSQMLDGDINAFPLLLEQIDQARRGSGEPPSAPLTVPMEGSLFPSIPAGNAPTNVDDSDHQLVLATAMEALQALQDEQDQNALDTGSMPLDFTRYVNPVLETFHKESRGIPSAQDRVSVEAIVSERVLQLYTRHLRTLRDYFGTMYESLVDNMSNDRNNEAWTVAHRQVSDAFVDRAEKSIPILARAGAPFQSWNFDHSEVLAGLLEDMATAADLRQDDLVDNAVADQESRRVRRVPRWLKQLGSRALVLGVNYVQGWLALQGMRKAALERERMFPKFPLL